MNGFVLLARNDIVVVAISDLYILDHVDMYWVFVLLRCIWGRGVCGGYISRVVSFCDFSFVRSMSRIMNVTNSLLITV